MAIVLQVVGVTDRPTMRLGAGRRQREPFARSAAGEVLRFAQHLKNSGEPNNSVPLLRHQFLSTSAEPDLSRDLATNTALEGDYQTKPKPMIFCRTRSVGTNPAFQCRK